MNNKELIIRNLVDSISESLIVSVYSKIVNHFQKNHEEISSKFDFYISVYYREVLLKSRILNNTGQNFTFKEIENIHLEFFNKNKDDADADLAPAVYRVTGRTGKKAISLLRVGHFTVIVSDNDEAGVHICALIIVVMFTLNKSAALVKEWGHFHDIQKYFSKTQKDKIATYYLSQVENISDGELGGHK